MAMTAINKQPGRHEIEELLPWHAAGTLSRRDADRVEQALAVDRELAHRYELVRQELAETIHLNETLGAPSARATERLFAAIDAYEAGARRRRPRPISRTRSLARSRAQLGGEHFVAMTGAKNFVGTEDSLTFEVGSNPKHVSHVRVTQTPDDLYAVTFFRRGKAPQIMDGTCCDILQVYAAGRSKTLQWRQSTNLWREATSPRRGKATNGSR
jgi:hypothetical protein